MLAVPAFAFAYGASADQLGSGLACAAGCIAGIPLTPDLDQETISSSEYSIIKWTMGLGFLWAMLWYPYARLLKHRSPLSHWPLLGTAGRLFYLGLFVAVAMALGWTLPQWPLDLIGWGIGGLVLSDTAHWLLDWKFGDSPRRRSRRRI